MPPITTSRTRSCLRGSALGVGLAGGGLRGNGLGWDRVAEVGGPAVARCFADDCRPWGSDGSRACVSHARRGCGGDRSQPNPFGIWLILIFCLFFFRGDRAVGGLGGELLRGL